MIFRFDLGLKRTATTGRLLPTGVRPAPPLGHGRPPHARDTHGDGDAIKGAQPRPPLTRVLADVGKKVLGSLMQETMPINQGRVGELD